jgi:hypothetical protein
MKNIWVRMPMLSLAAVVLAAACSSRGDDVASGMTIQSGSGGNGLTVTLANSGGLLRRGSQDFTLKFSDASGKPVDVGAAAVTFHMPAMGTMPAMNTTATLVTTDTPGIYRGTVDLAMAGAWQARIVYEGAAGSGEATLPITAQ